jgi:hypothetical protein
LTGGLGEKSAPAFDVDDSVPPVGGGACGVGGAAVGAFCSAIGEAGKVITSVAKIATSEGI